LKQALVSLELIFHAKKGIFLEYKNVPSGKIELSKNDDE
jgi:hypothetical protein